MTPPAISRFDETASAAPGSRGAEPIRSTTEPSATAAPSPVHRSRISMMSLIGNVLLLLQQENSAHSLRSRPPAHLRSSVVLPRTDWLQPNFVTAGLSLDARPGRHTPSRRASRARGCSPTRCSSLGGAGVRRARGADLVPARLHAGPDHGADVRRAARRRRATARRSARRAWSLYLLLGIVGVPLYADHKHGWDVFSGATGGYIVGFVARGGADRLRSPSAAGTSGSPRRSRRC